MSRTVPPVLGGDGRFVAWLVAAVLVAVTVGPTKSIVGQEIGPQQVREAIDKAIVYLRGCQQNDGSWTEWLNQTGGVTALATLALLNAGVPPEDPQIQRALARLRKIPPSSTYVTSLQTMVFCKATPKQDLLLISRNAKWLEAHQIPDGPRKGAWSYPAASGDNSNSQFALLGLYEAEQAGVAVSPQTWRLAKAYWEDCQNIDGSWGYFKGQLGTGSMTCAGIASLVITADRTDQSDAQAAGETIECCSQAHGGYPALDRALQWMGRTFTVFGNPGAPSRVWMLYYLYGVERVGRMTARRFIGGHDWYREGADVLVRTQDRLSGYWKGVGHAEDDPEIATSLALLFLSKGRRPVLLAKLKHNVGDDWNQHRNDAANLTRHVESCWQRDLTWQIVDLGLASVDDLTQSPVLYLCGSESPLPSDPERQTTLAGKLRDYLDRGGFIFAEAYCGGTGFDNGFRRLMEKVLPEREYRLRMLPPEHPVWYAEENVAPAHQRPLEGIDFGCRTSVVYVPLYPKDHPAPSLSCLWELARPGRDRDYSAKVKAQIEAALAIGTNVLAYATNRELRYKDANFAAQGAKKSSDHTERGRVHVATLEHPGGCNAAPRALLNLLEAAGRELNLRVDTLSPMLRITDEALFDYPLVFMHGRSTFHLTDLERKTLKTYLEGGGILFADSICSNRAFTESFRREIAAMFPGRPMRLIPTGDPLLKPTYGGFDVSQVMRRDPQIRGANDPLKASLNRVAPTLETIAIKDRYAVIFSPYDLSCALEKQDSLECQGYVREDAGRIGLNVLLYALHQ